ncbi:hypothetical protein AJ80_02926 [Polytolypa hystricis UAMH7299]|uniref:B30.2/SPRY domain-containing protein n=1 Tax=Polytolypa hystricis (strain UAMH7299) TaxID=1447883 RepID=A0A2B7YPM2_POLH7|nr:hypothetical protein AJ80_02926 [Polytolypa hystricis UAMH7299]
MSLPQGAQSSTPTTALPPTIPITTTTASSSSSIAAAPTDLPSQHQQQLHQPANAPSPGPTPSTTTSTAAAKNGTTRAKRQKRDSRKKREAKGDADASSVTGTLAGGSSGGGGGAGGGTGTGTSSSSARDKKLAAGAASASAIPSAELGMLMPILLADPRPTDILHPRARQLNFAYEKESGACGGKKWEFYEIADKLSNRNGFRYTYAVADPGFPHIKYRQTDVPPYYSRFSFEDSPAAITFSADGLAVSTNEPWHSARANVCAREGSYYYEAKVISGITRGAPSGPSARGHVRLGFARREADLDVNVGVDCYGYGIRDANGEVVNRMRCEYFFPKDEAIYEGDVIGMLITLPPLWLHKKIVEGTYDPAVDGEHPRPSEPTTRAGAAVPTNLIRDRIPFHLKSDFLWQQSHIFPTKHLRDYAFNLKETPTYGPPSPTNTEDPSLRTLPGSSITIFKNGVRMGTPFNDLYAFLPPASRATNGSNNLGIGERENADDGMIGYFPTVSCHNGGAVECRFEEPWWFGPPPPSSSSTSVIEDAPPPPPPQLPVDDADGAVAVAVAGGASAARIHDIIIRPMGERFNDQIVEDILADIVDEVEAEFHGWNVEYPPDPILNGVGVHGPNGPATATAATEARAAGGVAGAAAVAGAGGFGAGAVIDDGASVSVSLGTGTGTPMQGSVAGETVGDEDVDMML